MEVRIVLFMILVVSTLSYSVDGLWKLELDHTYS